MPAKRHPSERELIAGIRQRFHSPHSRALALGIGDDCALLRIRPGYQVAVTTDLLVEGRHFRRETHSPESSGHRCLARGLSDLAAMGAAPVAAFLSLALPSSSVSTAAGRRWLDRFLEGFHRLAREHKVPLAGGDTGQAPGPDLLADVVLVGQVAEGKALTRSGARPGDVLWVSGSLGGSAAELRSMLRRPTRTPRQTSGPQSFPAPRLALGRALARRHGVVTACLDISDGLSTDLLHLVQESRVSAVLEASRIPLHPLTRRLGNALDLALHGGEDYELLFTTRPDARLPRILAGVPLTRIGSIHQTRSGRPPVTLVDLTGHKRPLSAGGWEHFQESAASTIG